MPLTRKEEWEQPGRLTERLEEDALWWLPKAMRDAYLKSRKLWGGNTQPPTPPGE